MNLSASRLTAYTAAAAASIATAETASADIIYSGLQNLSISQGNSFVLDFDSNGFGDLRLKNYVFGGGNYQGATVIYAPGQLVGFSTGLAYVTNLAPGFSINSSSVGPTFFGSMAYGGINPNAQFNNTSNGLLGLSFTDGGVTHYGWVRVAVNNAAGTFTIIDWAYESNVGVGIAAGAVPEPSVACSLGLLAAGAAGLGIYRRRRATRAA